jgi:hypothetical protein
MTTLKISGAAILALGSILGLGNFFLELRRHGRAGTLFTASLEETKASRTNGERWCWGISSVLFAIGLLLIAI